VITEGKKQSRNVLISWMMAGYKIIGGLQWTISFHLCRYGPTTESVMKGDNELNLQDSKPQRNFLWLVSN